MRPVGAWTATKLRRTATNTGSAPAATVLPAANASAVLDVTSTRGAAIAGTVLGGRNAVNAPNDSDTTPLASWSPWAWSWRARRCRGRIGGRGGRAVGPWRGTNAARAARC